MEEHPQARFIVETLVKAGFIAYYAGGWVRDFLLNLPSDDIDIATSAPPETIQALFPHTVPIGISFGILLVIIDDHPYEVATFRQDFDYVGGRRPSRIAFACEVEDAKRRDFTINGMFYDPIRQKILDYVGGQEDLKKGVIRAIGDPEERIREDRLRMIRACRMACRFGFTIEEKTLLAIQSHATELFPAVAIERIVQEWTKAHTFGALTDLLEMLHRLQLLSPLFPSLQSLSFKEIKKRLSPTRLYPKETPPSAFLLPLLPEIDPESLALLLKLSKEEKSLLLFLAQSRLFFQSKAPSDVERVHFYAHPLSCLAESIFAAHLPDKEKASWKAVHTEKRKSLAPFIQRIQEKNPVVTSAHLLARGIRPGPEMGNLLRKAEEISIEQKSEDPDHILNQL